VAMPVVISDDEINARTNTVLVVPLTTKNKLIPPLTVAAPSAGPDSIALLVQTRAVDKSRLLSSVGTLSGEDMTAIENALLAVVGIT
jgi:mRNA-degrading endonuclease toxin of MazEF toxin-antitoxin module